MHSIAFKILLTCDSVPFYSLEIAHQERRSGGIGSKQKVLLGVLLSYRYETKRRFLRQSGTQHTFRWARRCQRPRTRTRERRHYSDKVLHVEKGGRAAISASLTLTALFPWYTVDCRLVCSGDDVCKVPNWLIYLLGKRIPHVNGVSTRSNSRAPSGNRQRSYRIRRHKCGSRNGK